MESTHFKRKSHSLVFRMVDKALLLAHYNMGMSGCVSFMFSKQGVLVVEAEGVDEDKLMEDALEAGASDFITDEEGVFEIRTEPNDCGAVREDLEAKGYAFVSAEVEYVPSTYTALTNPDDIKNMSKMLEMFEDNDDVQAVWHNIEIFKMNTKPGENVSITQGNAKDLRDFGDNIYDITLLLGPMYHLFTEDEKLQALSEAIRVTKKGGI